MSTLLPNELTAITVNLRFLIFILEDKETTQIWRCYKFTLAKGTCPGELMRTPQAVFVKNPSALSS